MIIKTNKINDNEELHDGIKILNVHHAIITLFTILLII